MNRNQCINVVRAINDITAIKGLLNDCINAAPEALEKRGTWQYYAKKMLCYLESDLSGVPPFSIFAEKGNKKLPFAAFSSLALADCPGKGDCVKFCYSLRAWRYPAAFFRQLQNSLLMRLNPEDAFVR
jgi:hypothetical protein